MVEITVMLWFAEVDGACVLRSRELPDGEVVDRATLPGGCEIEAVAPGPGGVLVLQGTWQQATVWRLGDEVEALGDSLALARHVAWSADGEPMVLTAGFDAPGDPFITQTWQIRDGAWTPIESTEEGLATVRAVVGGPQWVGRQAGASVDAWALERAPGFFVDQAGGPPRGGEAVLWGRAPAGRGEIVVRYAMLGVPRPVGPVWWHQGRRWRLLDDAALLEQPASVQGAGRWRLVSYEGTSPMVVDAERGRVVWRPPTDVWVAGALLR